MEDLHIGCCLLKIDALLGVSDFCVLLLTVFAFSDLHISFVTSRGVSEGCCLTSLSLGNVPPSLEFLALPGTPLLLWKGMKHSPPGEG